MESSKLSPIGGTLIPVGFVLVLAVLCALDNPTTAASPAYEKHIVGRSVGWLDVYTEILYDDDRGVVCYSNSWTKTLSCVKAYPP